MRLLRVCSDDAFELDDVDDVDELEVSDDGSLWCVDDRAVGMTMTGFAEGCIIDDGGRGDSTSYFSSSSSC